MQFISDIHLEYLSYIPDIAITSKNLCLIGDIGHPGTKIYDDFIQQCSSRYENVFMVYGNHEFFSTLSGRKKIIEPFNLRIECARRLPRNVYFLNDSCVYLNINTNKVKLTLPINTEEDYIKIIGSTLWSELDDKSSNFKSIYIDLNTKFTFNDQVKLFNKSKSYILNEINCNKNIKCILISHYGTHRLCVINSIDNKDTNNIDEISNCENLIACLNGHTHNNINTIIPGTNIKLISNCYGCKKEEPKTIKYNHNLLLNYIKKENTEISFEGLYSNNNINDFDIIHIINNRKNKYINIGTIDSFVSYIITSNNKDNSIIYANSHFEKLSGYSLEDIKGRNCRFLQSPDGIVKKNSERKYVDNKLLYNMRINISDNQESQYILINFKKSGERFYNFITIIPIIYKNQPCFVGLQSDLSCKINNFNLFNKNLIDKNILNQDLNCIYTNENCLIE